MGKDAVIGSFFILEKMKKKSLVIILKNLGTTCNIGCLYCAEARKKFVSLDKFISKEQILKLAKLTKDFSLNVLFHGGEPTILSQEYYEDLMDIFQEHNDDVYFGLQTNATLIDDNWIAFLNRNRERLSISVSLDGTKDVNKYRLDKLGKETFNTVCENIHLLEKNSIKTGLICTIVNSALGHEKDIYELLKTFHNLHFVKLNPCMDRNKDGSLPFWAISPQQYFSFVENFFDIMVKDGNWTNFYVEPIISILKNLQSVNSSFCNYSLNKCNNFISLYPNGEITSCDNFDLKHGYLGNLNVLDNINDILCMKYNKNLENEYNLLMNQCVSCDIKDICKGGCIAIRERYTDTSSYCVSMHHMVRHIKNIYEKLKCE